MKVLRLGLCVLMVLVLLVGAGAALFVATFDANRYKTDIESLVLKHTGHTLKIEGDIAVSVFPRLSAVINQASLFEPITAPSGAPNSTTNTDNNPFATLRSTRLSVALLPLLKSEVLVDGIDIQGLHIRLVRHAKGTFNVDDLLDRIAPKKTASHPPADKVMGTDNKPLLIDIQSLNVSDSGFVFEDQKNQQRWELTDVALTTGRLAPNASGELTTSFQLQTTLPAADIKIGFSTRYQWAQNDQHLTFTAAKASAKGFWQDLKALHLDLRFDAQADVKTDSYQIDTAEVSATAQIKPTASPAQSVTLRANTPKLVLSNGEVSGQALSINGQTTQGAQRIEAQFTLPKWQWRAQSLTIETLGLDLTKTDASLSQIPLHLALSGPVELHLKPETVKATLSGMLNASPLNLSINIERFKQPVIGFDAHLQTLDVRSLANAPTAATKPIESNAPSAPTSAASNTTTSPADKATLSTPFDFSVLRGYQADGQLRIDSIKSQALPLSNLQTRIKLHDGRLTVGPHQADVWDGKINGSWVIDANTQRVSMTETVSNIDIAALLSSLSATPALSGRGNLSTHLTATGTNRATLLSSLSGQLALELKDGAVKGVDLQGILQGARAALGRPTSQNATTDGQTRFTELTATAVIKNGVADNQDLSLKAPLFRVQGNGTIDLAAGQLNYLARVAVVDSADGPGGAELKALRGITVPIRLMGPIKQPSYRVDVSALAAELAKIKLSDDVTDKINKAVPGLGNALKGLFGR